MAINRVYGDNHGLVLMAGTITGGITIDDGQVHIGGVVSTVDDGDVVNEVYGDNYGVIIGRVHDAGQA